MDMSKSIIPKSDQMDADVLLSGPQTFTITDVKRGPSDDQPFNFILAEFPKPWRPCKTVRKIIVAAWGPETDAYHGRRLTLVRDPNVTWAGEAVGGIRVSHMSNLQNGKPMRVSVQETSRTKTSIVIQPLEDAPPPQPARDFAAEVDLATDSDELRVLWLAAKEQGAMTDELNARIMAAQKALQEADDDA